MPIYLSFVGLAPYRLSHLGNLKGMFYWINLMQEPEFRVAHRVADVERDQMQAKMHLYTYISAYIQAFNNK